MNFYSGEKLAGRETFEDIRCKCGARPQLAYKMLDPTSGLTVRMFRCDCGELRWAEDKE